MDSSAPPNVGEKWEMATGILADSSSSSSSSTDLKGTSPSLNPAELNNNCEELPQKHGSSLSRYLRRE
jgi:hypothetical protein